jgi:hypothetical protein
MGTLIVCMIVTITFLGIGPYMAIYTSSDPLFCTLGFLSGLICGWILRSEE